MKTSLFMLIVAAVVGAVWLGCQPPVSDEADVSVEGRVLDTDGTPLGDVTVRLVKTNVNILDAEWVIGHIVNQDKEPFLTTKTDADGRYRFDFTGADANAENQNWAAYFAAYVIHPDDPQEHMAVASDSFQFSNQKLDVTLPDLAFWDIPEGGVVVEADRVTLTFEPSALPPEDGRYLVHVAGTEWVAEVTDTTYSLPLTALEPCTNPVVDDPSECEPKTSHAIQVISLADGVRYRTAWHVFTAENPRGMGLWFRNADDNTSGRTCTDKVLFDLNDGKFSGDNAVQFFPGGGLDKADARCLLFDLGDEITIDEFFLQNGAVWFHKDAKVEIAAAAGDDPAAADFTVLHTWEGRDQRFPTVSLQIAGPQNPVRFLRVQFTDLDDKAFWQRLGELVVYPVL